MLIAAESSELIRDNTLPFLQLNIKGQSYINAKAARLLGFKHFDLLRFYYNPDSGIYYVANDPDSGAILRKYSGLLKFCDLKNVKDILSIYQIQACRVNLPFLDRVLTIDNMNVIEILNKPFNIIL